MTEIINSTVFAMGFSEITSVILVSMFFNSKVELYINLAIREYSLSRTNVFANVFTFDDKRTSTKLPILNENLLVNTFQSLNMIMKLLNKSNFDSTCVLQSV